MRARYYADPAADNLARVERDRKNVEARRARHKRYWEKNKEKLKARARLAYRSNPDNDKFKHIRRKYSLTREEYVAMESLQGYGCAICGKKNADGRRLYVDHDHSTGAVRGLLCKGCNGGLGMLRDNKENLMAAISYISKGETLVSSIRPYD